jgi:hypothetical protein
MSYPLRTKEDFARWAITADAQIWRDTCTSAHWCRLQPGRHLPRELCFLDWLVRDEKSWKRLKNFIASERRKLYRKRSKKLAS